MSWRALRSVSGGAGRFAGGLLWVRRRLLPPLRAGLLLGLVAMAAAPNSLAESNPRVEALAKQPNLFPDVLREARERYRREVRHFSATLERRQNKSEKPGGLSKWERIRLRVREKGGPWAVYLYWEKGPIERLEALYVHGKYEDKVWVKHPLLRLLPPFSFELRDPVVMKENRHPITKAGIGRLMDSLLDQCELAEKAGDAAEAFEYLGRGVVGGRPTIRIARKLPKRDFYYCHRAVLELDLEWGYPVKIQTVNWDGIVLEDVRYRNIKLNDPKVTEKQFDKDKIFSIFKILGP